MSNRTARLAGIAGLLAALVLPATVLAGRAGSSDALASDPPASAPALAEQAEEVEGTLEVFVEDRDREHRYHYYLRRAAGRLSLRFAASPPELPSGSRVRVRGTRVGEALAVDSGEAVQALAVALPNTFGEQRTLVILVNFQDNPTQPYSVSYARDVVFTTTSDFDRENSYQQTWLTGDVAGWFTIPVYSTTCDTGKIASEARAAAAAAGVDVSSYRRYVYGFPANACTWWGYGTVGGNPSHAWVKGSFQLRVVGHEMGHNFGLYHARSRDCGTETIGGTCTTSEYGDTVDIMGSASGHFSAFQKERLGWLAYGGSPPLTTVDSDGTYWIEPLESLGANAKALKVLQSIDPTTGKRTFYYVEQRRALGFDAFLSSNANVLGGVVVHLGSETSGRNIDLLDMTPETPSWSDAALVVGDSFYDASAGVTIAPLSIGNGGAWVQVGFGAQACVRANPAVSFSPAQSAWVTAGTTVVYAVSVLNTDSAGCGPSTFDMSGAVPAGWSASFGSAALPVAAGASASTSLQVASTSSTADGVYGVSATAISRSDSAYGASGSASYLVLSTLAVTVSTDRASYTRKQAASIRAGVSAASGPVKGVTVTFTIGKPNGTSAKITATTGADGSATVQFKPRPQDPSGVYQVRADGAMGGATGTAGTSFIVQ